MFYSDMCTTINIYFYVRLYLFYKGGSAWAIYRELKWSYYDEVSVLLKGVCIVLVVGNISKLEFKLILFLIRVRAI